jgi:hypothetical protein
MALGFFATEFFADFFVVFLAAVFSWLTFLLSCERYRKW